MAQPETRTIDTRRQIGAAFPRLRPAGQRPEIRATYLLFPSSPPGEWHPAIPSREPLQAIGPYIRAIAGSKILLSHPAGTRAFDQLQISLARSAGLRIVHSEGAEHLLVFGE